MTGPPCEEHHAGSQNNRVQARIARAEEFFKLPAQVEIVQTIADETGLTQVKSEEAVDAIISEIKATLSQGETVILRRFGSFAVRAKNAREGRNPKTGEQAEIPARRVVLFKAGQIPPD